MREEIEAIINEKLDKVEPLLEDFYSNKNIINQKIEEQNKSIEEKKQLLEKVNLLAEKNKEIIYDENSSIEDLEKIINKYEDKREV